MRSRWALLFQVQKVDRMPRCHVVDIRMVHMRILTTTEDLGDHELTMLGRSSLQTTQVGDGLK